MAPRRMPRPLQRAILAGVVASLLSTQLHNIAALVGVSRRERVRYAVAPDEILTERIWLSERVLAISRHGKPEPITLLDARRLAGAADWGSDPMIGLAATVMPPIDSALTLVQHGWPLPVLQGWTSGDAGRTSRVGVGTAGGATLAFLPTPVGAPLSVALWGMLWFALTSMLPMCRAALRRRAGRCPTCGYERRGLAGARCPECGADQSMT